MISAEQLELAEGMAVGAERGSWHWEVRQGTVAGGDQVSMQVESGFQASLAYQKLYKMHA